MPLLSTSEQMSTSSSSCSSSFDKLEPNFSTSVTNVSSGELVSNATTCQESEKTSTPPPQNFTRKRKRRNSTMIIKPARWSPPLRQHPTHTLMSPAPIETDFQPTFYNPNEIKHRRRISSQQYGILEDEYQINTKPNASKRHHLAELLGMTPRTVQIWFQNKRAKAKHQQGKPLHAEKISTRKSSTKLLATASPSHPSSTQVVSGPVDQFTFDDGRLDPIYLMDDYDMTAFMAASTSPSLSSTTSTVTLTPQDITNRKSSNDSSDDDKRNEAAVTVFMDGNSGQQKPNHPNDHGTTTPAPASSSASSSPLLLSSDTHDSFTMGLHHYLKNTNQHSYCDEAPFSASTASSSPSQQFSPLDSSFTVHHNTQHMDTTYSTMDASFYSVMKENDNDQDQLLRHDALYILNWIQKTPMELPIDGSAVPSWPYVMDPPDLQNDGCLNFGLDHDDWIDPFSVSA